VLTPEVTLLFRWGSRDNARTWHVPLEDRSVQGEGVIDIGHRLAKQPGATGVVDIVITADRRVVLQGRTDDSKWPGVRSKYTPWVHATTRELLHRGLITPNHRVFSGNWASLEGAFLGRAAAVAKRPAFPRSIVLYHGTSTDRLPCILREGLNAQPRENRTWKERLLTGHPPHRVTAVYLTADTQQAEFYGRKAVRVGRRHGVAGAAPVLLQVTVPAREFSRLRADDDWLWRKREDPAARPEDTDWYGSLTEFGQVAMVGAIPPSRLKVLSSGQ